MKRKQSTLTAYLSPSSSSSSSSTPRGKQEEEEPTTKRAKKKAATAGAFDYTLDFKSIDMRQHPELYRVGRGEQGVLSVEPYKSEILPHWRFRTPDVAAASADAILALYRDYKQRDDFIGMDMSRKFLQMGFTRSRRYANHRSGRKYSSKDKEGGEMMTEAEKDEVMANSAFKDVRNRRHTIKTRTKEVLPLDHDPVKAQSAEEFRQRLDVVKADPDYARMKAEHQRMYEGKHDATKPKPKARTRTESATPAVKR